MANTKNGSFSFIATPSSEWIKLNQRNGTITTQSRILISFDSNNIPKEGTGTINITSRCESVSNYKG
jgi:hypothetical protein